MPLSAAKRLLSITTAIALVVQPMLADASPLGGQVTAGSASITSSTNQTTIDQTSQRAVIDWNSFNVGSNETVQFVQPSASSVTLNRIHDSGTSQIDGQILANGNVWLINPNGVVFGKDAQVNVGGLLATTGNISNQNFMNGDYTFDTPGNATATITNNGTITLAEGGLVALVAPNVINNGVIQARLGRVVMASGDTYTIDLYGDGLINLQVGKDVTSQLVANNGSILANGGTVTLTTAATTNVVDSLINVTGLIETDSVGTQTGTITLNAQGGTTLVSGTLSAQGKNTDETGGLIQVLGTNVGLLNGDFVLASGNAGGGTVQIGGDFHGGGSIPTATHTIVQQGAVIDASAIVSGNGGFVAVWADSDTTFAGTIKATGGATGGNGGYVETSGKSILNATGTVNASAPKGKAGQWLLDPNDITIVDGDTGPGSDSNVTGTPNFTTTNDSATLTNTSIENALNNGTSVTVTTGTSGTNSGNGDIEVSANITKSAGGDASLTLDAIRNITIDSGIEISSTSGKLNTTLNANYLGTNSQGGYIYMGGSSGIYANGGNITLNAIGNSVVLNSDVTLQTIGNGNITLTGAAAQNGNTNTAPWGGYDDVGIILWNGCTCTQDTLQTDAGNITLNGVGSNMSVGTYGMYIFNGVLQSNTGNITLNGIGGTGTSPGWSNGVVVSDSMIQTGGNVTITGVGGSGGQQGVGVWLLSNFNTNQITTTGSGNITINGTGGVGSGNASDDGVLTYGVQDITSQNGNIAITGTGGYSSVDHHGIYLTGNTNITSTGTGTITLTGTAVSDTTGIETDGSTDGSSPNTITGNGAINVLANSTNLNFITITTPGTITYGPLPSEGIFDGLTLGQFYACLAEGSSCTLAGGANGNIITRALLSGLIEGALPEGWAPTSEDATGRKKPLFLISSELLKSLDSSLIERRAWWDAVSK